jgi:acetyl/propionyl-CoA carboxylase alpha subunit/acetyl-CoA carboxylase carboxyltransferase component
VKFQRVLIANRGEIAIRVARAAAGLGIKSLAVFAPADADGLHARHADEAHELPMTADPVCAYLDAKYLVRLAKDKHCDCVHPGYGFLAENSDFARLCAEAGLVFIGPSAEVLTLFGDKTKARTLAASIDVPTIEGTPPLKDAKAARGVAAKIGYPVMLKAAAGGGGRGMRAVTREEDMAEAFARCQSEAHAAFGDSSVFLERQLRRPRHIEVQVLGDAYGALAHLYERDCSVQERNQKIVEVAPAPNLDQELRRRLTKDALAIARAGKLTNAGTVEFLVEPETGAHYFIECNPRIQVEHTVTEAITGVDLVEAQFRLAAGETLEALALPDTAQPPRSFAVEARIIARGVGQLTAYKEPAGPGVRVDSCAYLGLVPPPDFDPMFAKLICRSNSTGSFSSALDRALRALDEFHIAGLPTNIAQLQAILAHPEMRAGDARTSLLPEIGMPADASNQERSRTLAFLDKRAETLLGQTANATATSRGPDAAVEAGQEPVICPLDGVVVAIEAEQGVQLASSQTILVVSAMKMETSITAPCAGELTAMLSLTISERVSAGQILAAITPSGGVSEEARTREQDWAPILDDVHALQALAHARFAPGSQDPGVVRQRARGKLSCRERIDLLFDPESFREVGSVAGFAGYDAEGRIAEFTPANHIGGLGKIETRPAVVCADDFTSRGGHADGAIGAKSGYLDRLALEMRCPSIRLLDGSSGGGSVAAMVPKQAREGESQAKESTGAIIAGRPRVSGGGGSTLPGHLGGAMYAEQLATLPVVNVLLGSVVGIGAAKAVLGHFSVMVRDIAQLFVAGPPVVAHAMGYEVTKEDLGDWRIHCRNGAVDNIAESEHDAIAQAKRILSYLPTNVYEPAPVLPRDSADPIDRRAEELLSIIPRRRTATFDMRRAIALMADKDSFFEIGPLWGTDQIVGFARFGGYPVGVLASDSRHANGGAMTADGCDKQRRHIDLCDVFHLPILNLVDNPGFAVGIEHEKTGAIRKGGEWMIAFAQTKSPLFTVIMRRSFGVAGNNAATPRAGAHPRVIWPAADMGSIPPEGGIEAAYKRQLAEAADPAALRAEINARIEGARGPLGPLSRFQVEEMIDPRDTRRIVCEWVENAWRVAVLPANLGPRALGFRP